MLNSIKKALGKKSDPHGQSSSKDPSDPAQKDKALSDAELSQVAGGRMLNPQPLPPRYR